MAAGAQIIAGLEIPGLAGDFESGAPDASLKERD